MQRSRGLTLDKTEVVDKIRHEFVDPPLSQITSQRVGTLAANEITETVFFLWGELGEIDLRYMGEKMFPHRPEV